MSNDMFRDQRLKSWVKNKERKKRLCVNKYLLLEEIICYQTAAHQGSEVMEEN
jgi:hypothetical protein